MVKYDDNDRFFDLKIDSVLDYIKDLKKQDNRGLYINLDKTQKRKYNEHSEDSES